MSMAHATAWLWTIARAEDSPYGPAMPSNKPLWLVLAPVIFLLLWSGGFSVAKLGITHAEPLSFLALRYAAVCVILAPFIAVMRPAFPKAPSEWMHLAIVGLLIQTVYFGLSYIAFKAGVSAGGVAIIVCLQPILVGLIAPRFAGETVGAALGGAGAGPCGCRDRHRRPIGDRRAAPLGHRRRGGRAHRHHHRHAVGKALRQDASSGRLQYRAICGGACGHPAAGAGLRELLLRLEPALRGGTPIWSSAIRSSP